QGTYWGEPSRALLAHFGARATVLPRPLDFGDSYTDVVLRNVPAGGFPLIAYFQMDKMTGGLKRIQLERPRHGVTAPAFREALALWRELAADLAALVGIGVNIDVALARLQIGELRIGHRARADDRAGRRVAQRHRHPGIGAGTGPAMDVRRSRRAAQPGIFD